MTMLLTGLARALQGGDGLRCGDVSVVRTRQMLPTSTFVAGERSTPTVDLSFAAVVPGEALGRPLREDLLDTWVAVTEADGAVGFTAPADVAAVESALDSAAALAHPPASNDPPRTTGPRWRAAAA
jgi:hypothetical protein